MRKAAFNKTQKSDLRRLGVTDAQLPWLERALPLIRIDIEGYASNTDVRDTVAKVHDALAVAEKEVRSMYKGASKAKTEAAGHLASGAASIDPLTARAAIADVESATDGTVPDPIDVPTLLRLLVLAAERGLAEVPKRQYRQSAPVRSIERILAALNRPADGKSHIAAAALAPGRYRRSFVELCELVFRAASERGDVPVDRAIRGFLETYRLAADGRSWLRIGRQPR